MTTPPTQLYREIVLTNGYVTLVDQGDFDWLSAYTWSAISSKPGGSLYAARSVYVGARKSETVRMHREILGLKRFDKRKADHENLNTLDNRRLNLRVATTQQNAFNQARQKRNTSGYKGVGWVKRRSKWRARIVFNYKEITLGFFDTVEQAHTAYCAAAKRLCGEFARFV